MSEKMEQLRKTLEETIAISDDWRQRCESSIKDCTKALDQRDAAHKKLAILFDHAVYSDSLGVPGSSFSVCRWCGGGSGPGGNPGFSHKDDCLFDDEALEKAIAHVWEEASNAVADRDAAEALAEQRRVEIVRLLGALEEYRECDRSMHNCHDEYRCSACVEADTVIASAKSSLAPHTEGKETK